jgi:hypothetical protein
MAECERLRVEGHERRYVCLAHREHHHDSPSYCEAKPFDAIEADRMVVAGIDRLLADADALREQLGAGHAIERQLLEAEVSEARAAAAKMDCVKEKAMLASRAHSPTTTTRRPRSTSRPPRALAPRVRGDEVVSGS